MFTGIVEACVPVRSLERVGDGARLVLPAPALPDWRAAPGASIAVAGACLSIAGLRPPGDGVGDEDLVFDLSAETLERTWFADLAPGSSRSGGRLVNLERAMILGERLDGHLVAGHIDGGASIVAVEDSGDGGRLFGFEVDPGLERYLFDKASITLDGISLTVVRPTGRRFDVAVIPLTLEVTHLGRAEVGQRVNVEADLVGKWIERLLPAG